MIVLGDAGRIHAELCRNRRSGIKGAALRLLLALIVNQHASIMCQVTMGGSS